MGLGIMCLAISRLSLAIGLHYLGHIIPGIEVRHMHGRLNRIQKRAGSKQMLHNHCHKRNIIVLGVVTSVATENAQVIYDD